MVVGDINTSVGTALIQSLVGSSPSSSLSPRAIFQRCDVASWTDQRALFTLALKEYGSIDIVLANAGVTGKETLLKDEYDEDGPGSGSIENLKQPSFPDLDVNLTGAIYSTKLATHTFRHRQPSPQGSLVLTGSAASYLDTPPLWAYTAAKHGVLGLMRSLRSQFPKWGPASSSHTGMTINLIAPWFTKTPMAATLGPRWGNRPANDAEVVARTLLWAGVSGVNGKGLWVGGNKTVEMEDALTGCRGVWLGEKMAEAVEEGQRALEA